ncbi:MptD family putative ECF transporter S component [Corynebacterium uterequi]|uniref:MptD family putative ECF transporter S component n=1 Tax=Corynebacterium uterequi TaxID=1072256 RepID=UPI000640CDB3|nr:MptD family putative ECF transporter S component [Corynebacterium uterequi]
MRNLVNVGVFTAVYFVVLFATGMLGVFSPVGSVVGWLIGIVANAVVVTLFQARTPRVWGLGAMGLLIGLLMVATGHSLLTVVGGTVAGVAGGAISRIGDFRSPLWNSLGYGVFSMWIVSPIASMLWNREAYIDYVSTSMNDPAYGAAWNALFSDTFIICWTFIVAAVAFASGLLGNRILAKHFRRAGLA